MVYNWDFGNWFCFIWFVCYFITFLAFIYKDNQIECWVVYSLFCMFAWPVVWFCFISEIFVNKDENDEDEIDE